MIEERLVRSIVLFFVLTIIFVVLETAWPSVANQPKWRRGTGVDILYWFFTPIVSQLLSALAIAAVIIPLFLLLGRSINQQLLESSYGPLAQLPPWLQGLMVVVIGDFVGYWTHRWFHTKHLWDYHAIHHSSEQIDWLSAVRLHPINDVISRVMQALPALLLGFSPLVVEIYVPFLTFYIALIHANVSWTYGPFRYVIASPAFHRWHHTKDFEGVGRNFAGLFPIFDILFGTFYMPRGKQPNNFGIDGESMSDNFWEQLWYPFRKLKKTRKQLLD